MGDHRLSPAYDLLNTQIHVEDDVFALDGLMPQNLAQGSISNQFLILAEKVGLTAKQYNTIMETMLSDPNEVQNLIRASFLDEKAKRQYIQTYQTRLKKIK